MPRRGIGLELLVLPERSEGKQEFRLNCRILPERSEGRTRCGLGARPKASLLAGGIVCCIRLMAGALRQTESGWQSAARWLDAKRPSHQVILKFLYNTTTRSVNLDLYVITIYFGYSAYNSHLLSYIGFCFVQVLE